MDIEQRLRPVKKSTLTDMVAQQLIELIKQDMKSGDRLPSEKELMKLLKVGRSSVREALRALEMIGLIETRVGDGSFVVKDSKMIFRKPMEWGVFDNKKSITDLIEARSIFEIAIIDLVVERITDKELEAMEKVVEQMEKTSPPHQEFLLQADYRFHEIFVQATRNDVLIEMMSLSMRTLEKERSFTISKLKSYTEIAKYHREVYEKLKNRDKIGTREAMIAHMKNTEMLFKAHLNDLKET